MALAPTGACELKIDFLFSFFFLSSARSAKFPSGAPLTASMPLDLSQSSSCACVWEDWGAGRGAGGGTPRVVPAPPEAGRPEVSDML